MNAPGSTDEWRERGRKLFRMGRDEEALSSFQQGLAIDPNDFPCWANSAMILGRLGRSEEALTAYERALELNPRVMSLWNNRGALLMDSGRPEEALTCFERATEVAPEDARPWANRAAALASLGRHEEALPCYERVLEIDPTDAAAWNNTLIALQHLERYEEAVAFCDRLLEISPDKSHHSLRVKGALLHHDLGRPGQALVCFDQGLEVEPNDADLWAAKADVLDDLGRSAEALACYRQAVKLNPDSAESWRNMGVILTAQGQEEEALACYERALELDPSDADLHMKESAALFRLGRLEDAVASCQRGLQIDARNIDLWNNQAVALEALKRYEDAVTCYERALEITPDRADFWKLRAALLSRNLGRHFESLACLEQGVERCPDDEELLQLRNAMRAVVSNLRRAPGGTAPPNESVQQARSPGPRVLEYKDLIIPLNIPLTVETRRGYEATRQRYDTIVLPQLKKAREDGWRVLESADLQSSINANRLDHSRLPDDPLDYPAVIHSVLVRLVRLVAGSSPSDPDAVSWERRVISVPLGVKFGGREEDLPRWYRECEGLILRQLQEAGQDGWEPEHRTDLSFLMDKGRVAGEFPLLVSATISLKRPVAADGTSVPSQAPELGISDAPRTRNSSDDRVRQLLREAEQGGTEAVEELLARAFASDPLIDAHAPELADLAQRLLARESRRYMRLWEASLPSPARRTREDEEAEDVQAGSGLHHSQVLALLALQHQLAGAGPVPIWFAPAVEGSLWAPDALRLFFGHLNPEQTCDLLAMAHMTMSPGSAIDFAQHTAAVPESIPHVVALMLRSSRSDAMEHWFVNRPVSEATIPHLEKAAAELIEKVRTGPAGDKSPGELFRTWEQQARVLLMVMHTMRRQIRELKLDSDHPAVQRFGETWPEAAAMWNFIISPAAQGPCAPCASSICRTVPNWGRCPSAMSQRRVTSRRGSLKPLVSGRTRIGTSFRMGSRRWRGPLRCPSHRSSASGLIAAPRTSLL